MLPATSSDGDPLSARSSVANSNGGTTSKGSDKSFLLGLSLPSPGSPSGYTSSFSITPRPPQLPLHFDGPMTPVTPSPNRRFAWAFMDDMASTLSRAGSSASSNISSFASSSCSPSLAKRQGARSAAVAWRDAAAVARGNRKKSILKPGTLSGTLKDGHVKFTQSTINLEELKADASALQVPASAGVAGPDPDLDASTSTSASYSAAAETSSPAPDLLYCSSEDGDPGGATGTSPSLPHPSVVADDPLLTRL
jgi:hypothetical protein